MGLFGGSSKSSSAQGSSQASLNSSGWVVGSGKANGGSLSASDSLNLPWYAYASVAAVGAYYFWIKRKKRA